MFYPNDPLFKRTPGIATVWLMATLGARHHSSKVNKQEILQVNIPQACETVQNPEAPLALRLRSNLLYGISRIYSQKCAYILTDAEAAQAALKSLFIKSSVLDPRAGKARPETLIVPDDPAFIPGDFPIIDFDASAVDSSIASFLIDGDDSFLSNASSKSAGSLHDSGSLQLDIPPSGSFENPFEFDIDLGQPAAESCRLKLEPEALLGDLGFVFDETGNLVEQNVQEQPEQLEQPIDDGFLPTAEEIEPVQESVEQDGHQKDTRSVHVSTESEYIEVPQIRLQRNKLPLLPRDDILQVLNSDLQRWSTHYLTQMAEDRGGKLLKKSSKSARCNAIHVFQRLGSLSYRSVAVAQQLVDLTDDVLAQLIFRDSKQTGSNRKRKRQNSSEDISSTSESSKKRRGLDEAVKAATHDQQQDDLGFLPIDEDPSVELAREAMATLEDFSSQFPLPWSGSRAGSIRSGPRSRRGSILSARRTGNMNAMRAVSVHSTRRISPRHPSISPLNDRGSLDQINDRLNTGRLTRAGEDDLVLGVESIIDTSPHRAGATTQDRELFGPAAEVDTQTAAESQWLTAALSKESNEFLAFIQNALIKKQEDNGRDDINKMTVRFDELLPVAQHSRTVAAQGFLHVLSLANRSIIKVTQKCRDGQGYDLWWAPLEMSLIEAIEDEEM